MNTPTIILISPQLGENIGMVARAMLNCGLTDLRIVNPRDGWPSESAARAASGALEKGVTVSVHDTTQDAIADLHFKLATTARPRDMVKAVYTATEAMEKSHTLIAQNQKVGVLFGGERSGLNNDDIALANAIITIPLNPEFTSLNLAQAVLLIAYEFMIKGKILPNEAKQAEAATAEEIDFFTSRLNAEIEKAGFFRSADMMPTAKRAVTNLFTRQSWTTQDIAMFQGILSAFTKDK